MVAIEYRYVTVLDETWWQIFVELHESTGCSLNNKLHFLVLFLSVWNSCLLLRLRLSCFKRETSPACIYFVCRLIYWLMHTRFFLNSCTVWCLWFYYLRSEVLTHIYIFTDSLKNKTSQYQLVNLSHYSLHHPPHCPHYKETSVSGISGL